jgi:hypothetical protein
MRVVYSAFNLTRPPIVDAWELFLKTRNDNNSQPYGQNSSTGIWAVNFTAYHNYGEDIYARYNDSNIGCISRMNFRSQNFTVNPSTTAWSLNISNLTVNPQKIIESLNSTTGNANIWTYTDVKCSSYTGGFILPDFCFWSFCSNCTKTYDWNTTLCEVYQ